MKAIKIGIWDIRKIEGCGIWTLSQCQKISTNLFYHIFLKKICLEWYIFQKFVANGYILFLNVIEIGHY